jgi:hypothetical protein
VFTWVGFFGKRFQFCIEKIASKKVDLALDTKKQAAWVFFQLHRSLATLEEACSFFLQIARPRRPG